MAPPTFMCFSHDFSLGYFLFHFRFQYIIIVIIFFSAAAAASLLSLPSIYNDFPLKFLFKNQMLFFRMEFYEVKWCGHELQNRKIVFAISNFESSIKTTHWICFSAMLSWNELNWTETYRQSTFFWQRNNQKLFLNPLNKFRGKFTFRVRFYCIKFRMHFTEILQLIALMYHMKKPFKSKKMEYIEKIKDSRKKKSKIRLKKEFYRVFKRDKTELKTINNIKWNGKSKSKSSFDFIRIYLLRVYFGLIEEMVCDGPLLRSIMQSKMTCRY